MNTNPLNAAPSTQSRELLPPRLQSWGGYARADGKPRNALSDCLRTMLNAGFPSGRLFHVEVKASGFQQVWINYGTNEQLSTGEPMNTQNTVPNATGSAVTPYGLGAFASSYEYSAPEYDGAFGGLFAVISSFMPPDMLGAYVIAFMGAETDGAGSVAWAVWYPCLADATTPPARGVSVTEGTNRTPYDRVIDEPASALSYGRPIFTGSDGSVQRQDLLTDGIRWVIQTASGDYYADAAFYLNPWDVAVWIDMNTGEPSGVTLQPVY